MSHWLPAVQVLIEHLHSCMHPRCTWRHYRCTPIAQAPEATLHRARGALTRYRAGARVGAVHVAGRTGTAIRHAAAPRGFAVDVAGRVGSAFRRAVALGDKPRRRVAMESRRQTGRFRTRLHPDLTRKYSSSRRTRIGFPRTPGRRRRSRPAPCLPPCRRRLVHLARSNRHPPSWSRCRPVLPRTWCRPY